MSEVLRDGVEAGASVGFLWPLSPARAEAFWRTVAASLERGERLLWVAEDEQERLVGTVQVLLNQPENQPHRGDLVKMLVHRRARRRGVGAALLREAEHGAWAAGKRLLVLDTASEEAARLYEKEGWRECGRIPDYALLPDGRPCETTFFFKALEG